MAKQKGTGSDEQQATEAVNPHLNPALEGKYRIKDTHCPLVLNTPIGDIDFRTLTEEQAEQLCEKAFEFLEKVSS